MQTNLNLVSINFVRFRFSWAKRRWKTGQTWCNHNGRPQHWFGEHLRILALLKKNIFAHFYAVLNNMTKPSMQYVSWYTTWLPRKCDFKTVKSFVHHVAPTANEDIFSIIPAPHNLSLISFSIVSCRSETYGLDNLTIVISKELLECDSLMKKLGWLASFQDFSSVSNYHVSILPLTHNLS